MKLFSAIVALSSMSTASASLRGTDGIVPTGMVDLLQHKQMCEGPTSGGLQAACDPSGFVSKYCMSGYFCEPIIGDPNQKGQCISGGGLQASCDPANLGAGCQCGYYCEPIIGDPKQAGQCISGGGLQASCDPNTGFGCQAGFDCQLILGNSKQKNGQCIPRPPAPTPGTIVGQDCGGQQMPKCGTGTITMCCPPSKKKAKKGYGSTYLCVNSSGGMKAQCPKKGYELDFSELVTEW